MSKQITSKPYQTPIVGRRFIVKSNQINEAIFKLNAVEYRLILLLISQVQEKDNSSLKYRFHTKTICSLLGMDKNKAAYTRIKDSVDGLHTKPVYIECDGVEIKHNWLISSYYSSESGYFVLELNPNLKPYFLNLKGHFTKYKISFILPLTTTPSIRLYELLKQYEALHERKIDAQKLRLLLGLEDTDYPSAYDFKRRVLLPALKEINDKTDISTEYTEIKEGRKTWGYQFMVAQNESHTPTPIIDQRLLSFELLQTLEMMGLSAAQIQHLSAKYTENFIAEHVTHTLARHEVRPYKSLPNYLLIRLREHAIIQKNLTNREFFPVDKMCTEVNQSVKTLAKEQLSSPTEVTHQEEYASSTHNETVVIELSDLPEEELENLQLVQEVFEPDAVKAPNATKVVPKKAVNVIPGELYKELQEFGVSVRQIKGLIRKYDAERIRLNLNYTKERHEKTPLGSPVSYLLDAVRENYQQVVSNDSKGREGRNSGIIPPTNQPPTMDELRAIGTRTKREPEEVPIEQMEHEQITLFDGEGSRQVSLDIETLQVILEYRTKRSFARSKKDVLTLLADCAENFKKCLARGVSIEIFEKEEKEIADYLRQINV